MNLKIVILTYSLDTVPNLMMDGKIFVTQKHWFSVKNGLKSTFFSKTTKASQFWVPENEIPDTFTLEMTYNHILQGIFGT